MLISPLMQPLAIRFGYIRDKKTLVFLGPNDEVVISRKVKKVIAVLSQCNGYASIQEIRERTSNINDAEFRQIITLCLKERILVDSRMLHVEFHRISASPGNYVPGYDPSLVRKLLEEDRSIKNINGEISRPKKETSLLEKSGFVRLLRKRRSTRSFESRPIPREILTSLLRCMYWTGEGMASTPSAGGLYPLQIYIATADPAQEEIPIVMRYDPKTGLLYKTQRAISGSMLALALDRENPPNGYVIFIVGELERDSRKYGNRGYRLIHLDAGHAAQNAYLFGAEQGLGILEYAGFRDENTAELLGINYPQEAVVIALIVGYEDKKTTVPQFSSVRLDYLHLLKQELVGPGKPVEWVQQIQFGISPYELKRAAAIASYRDTKPGSKPGAIHRRCQGISTSSVEAGIKAIAEAYERYVSGLVRWDQVATAEELSNRNNQWVDPRLYTPYTKEQYEGPFSHLKPFSTTETLQWVLGKRMATNESVYVPIELTFYPIDQVIVQRKTCYEASSNGVAAFPDEETATEKALLELIERDAICTMWYSKCPVTAIPQKNLDLDTRLRMRRWEELGWEVKCLNITRDSIPVVLCIIFSKKRRPHFVSGAAAAWTYKEAAQKAMDEAELMLTARKQSRRQRPNPKKVRSPLDHGILFFEYEMLATLDWLIEAKTEKIQERETPDLIKLFDPIKVNLTQNEGKGPLSVVRVLSQKLMPISFGYGTEHIDHPRMRMLGLKWNRSNPATPHFFA